MFDFEVYDYYCEEQQEKAYVADKGKYGVQIVASEIKPTFSSKNDETGKDKSANLYLEFKILNDKKFNEMIIKEWLCIRNKNDFSQRIARQRLARLAIAVGLSQLKEASELLDKTLYIDVYIEKDKNGYDVNKISKYIRETDENKIVVSSEEFNDKIPF